MSRRVVCATVSTVEDVRVRRAAKIEGKTVAVFVRDAVLAHTERVIERDLSRRAERGRLKEMREDNG